MPRGSSRRAPQPKPKTAKDEKDAGLVDAPLLRELYTQVLKCRVVDERAHPIAGSRWRDLGYASVIGHEAVLAGATFGLRPRDALLTSERSIGAKVLQGSPMSAIVGELLRGPEATRKLTPVAAATQIARATAIALERKLRGTESIVVVVAPQSVVDAGTWTPSVQAAALMKLPVIYLLESRSATPYSQVREKAGSVYAIPVDGSDAVAVYRVAQECMVHARNGGGPVVVSCRMSGQARPSSGPEPIDRWRHDDPVIHLEDYMRARGAWSDEWKKQLVATFNAEIDAAIRAWQALPEDQEATATD